ncbi:MAG: hypothetical protein H7210_08775 [Pyrinomonadaceae bacterium]|nr:hypothetical protein [Phycisphaerales bacterium]
MPTTTPASRVQTHRYHRCCRATVIGAVLLLMSCSGQPRSAGPSPVREDDEESTPSADLASILRGQEESTQDLQALIDEQDPSAWSTKTAKTPGSVVHNEPTILESPDFKQDAEGDPVERRQPRQASAKTGKPKSKAVHVDADSETPAENAPASPAAPIDVANETRPVAPSPSLPSGPTPVTESPSSARARLVGEIASILQQENQASGGTSIEREGLGLLALDVVQPGSVDAELSAFSLGLSSAEAKSFDSLKSLFRTLGNQAVAGGRGGSVAAVLDAARLQSTLHAHAAQLALDEPLLISTAALCTSVDGYGRYAPFASTTFMRGRAHPVILYLSVEHVTQKEVASMIDTTERTKSDKATSSKVALGSINAAVNLAGEGPSVPTAKSGNDGIDWAIDLTQSAVLYHDTDNLPVFDFGEQNLRDTARDKRRDFCIARRIDLPASLSLGRYNLKVTVRDKAGNASAEAIIPIQIVADATLAK